MENIESTKLQVKQRYGVAPNGVLNDNKLSLRAKGLYTYIQSKPDGWNFAVKRIEKENKDGREAIASAISELENAGLLTRTQAINSSKGKFSTCAYILTEKAYIESLPPCTGLPSPAKPSPEMPSSAKPQTYKERNNKTIVLSNDNTSKQEYNINVCEEKIKPKAKPLQQFDILSEEIYQAYMLNMPIDKRKYAKKAQACLYIATLLKTYDSTFLLSCVNSYKKTVESKWWKAPQYFFSHTTNPQAKEYMLFLSYSPHVSEATFSLESIDERNARIKKENEMFM